MKRLSLRQHFYIALALGLLFRLLTSWFVYGAQSLDDYRHGIWPAYSFWAKEYIDLPTYRSMLLVGILGNWLKVGAWFDWVQPFTQVRWMYALLAVMSLTSIYAAYLFAKKTSSELFGKIFLYLTALYALMPFIGTRAFGETVSTGWLLLGCALIFEEERRSQLFWGFIALGIAVLFRFQLGIFYVALMFMLGLEKNTKAFSISIWAGLVILSAQMGIDWLSDRYPLETIWAYFDANKNVSDYGVQPWYNTWLTTLGFLFFPLSARLFLNAKNTLQKYKVFFLPAFLFLLSHSLVPHKEERFLFPILGICLLFLSAQWADLWNKKSVKYFFTPAFVLINSILLILVTFNNSQASEFEPAHEVQNQYQQTLFIDVDSITGQSFVKDFYVRQPSWIRPTHSEELAAEFLLHWLRTNDSLILMTSNPAYKNSLDQFSSFTSQQLECSQIKKAQSFLDQVIYAGNPKNNQRRRPTWFVICHKP